MNWQQMLRLGIAILDGDTLLTQHIAQDSGKVEVRCRDPTCVLLKHLVWGTGIGGAKVRCNCQQGVHLCLCDPPCIINGWGARFVRNLHPVNTRFGHWRLIAGTTAQAIYADSEPPPGQRRKSRYGATTQNLSGRSLYPQPSKITFLHF